MRRLAVDFGDFATVIAETGGSGNDSRGSIVSSGPNLVYLAEDGSRIMGQDVYQKGLDRSPSTVRHLRHFILRNSPVQVRCGQHTVSYPELGRDYLIFRIGHAIAAGECDVDELVFSAPSDSPPFYREWLGTVAAGVRIPKYQVLDEVSAAAAGYGIPLKKETVLMLVDIGGESTRAVVASLTPSDHLTGCHVIASSVVDIGGNLVVRWIAGSLLQCCGLNSRHWKDEVHSSELLAVSRKVQEDLRHRETIEVSVPDPQTGKTSVVSFSRHDLENTLRDHNIFSELDRCVGQTLAFAESRGCSSNRIQDVLMTGDSSLIPPIQSVMLNKIGKARVLCSIPETAVALGASLYPERTAESQILMRDYALRYWDAGALQHEYRYIARCGTAYPTRQETARILIGAAYDGQTRLGLAVYALGNGEPGQGLRAIELVADHNGRTCCIEQTGHAEAVDAAWINESAPTILVATPPGTKGDVRFELTFRIDSLGILRLDARDVLTGKMILENHACAALT